MTSNESWRKYLEAGAAVGQATAARAEDIAKRLFDPDEDERESAWRDLEQLTRFGRLMGEQLAEMARAELSRQLKSHGGSLDQLFERISDLLGGPPPAPAEHRADAVLEASVIATSSAEAAETKKPKAKQHHTKADAERAKKNKKKQNKKQKKKEKDGPQQPAHRGGRVLTLEPPPHPSAES